MKVAVVGVTGLVGTRMMEVLFTTTEVMVQYLEVVVTFVSIQIATQSHLLVQTSRTPTTTRQRKGTAFSRVAQETTASKSRILKCSELMLKRN